MRTVLAPYRSIVQNDIVVETSMTYYEYHRYLHNLKIMYARHYPSTAVQTRPTAINEHERGLILEVYSGLQKLSLSEEQSELLDNLSQHAAEAKAWIILDLKNSIQYTKDIRRSSIIMPSSWVRDIVGVTLEASQSIVDDFLWDKMLLQDLPLSEDPFEDPQTIVLHDLRGLDSCGRSWAQGYGGSGVTNLGVPGLTRHFQYVYVKTVDWLYDLYQRGSIVFSSLVGGDGQDGDGQDGDGEVEDFINRWELATVSHAGMWHPQWWNVLVTKDRTRFLLEQWQSGNRQRTYRSELALSRARVL